jgi:hypothetical protein
VFAAVVIVRQRGIGGIFATLHENLIQLATWFQVGHAALGLCPVQDVTSEAERRRRFVPFSAMLSIGVIVTVVRQLVADPTQLLR